MEIIIFFIVIAVIISNAKKKAAAQAKAEVIDTTKKPHVKRQTLYNQSRQETVPNQARRQTVPNQPRTEKSAIQLKEEIWSRLSEESKAKMSQRDTYQQMTLNDLPKNSADRDISAADQIRNRRMEERNTSILDRAKGNNAENAKDVTLITMEAEHNHSERVALATHHHPEDNLEESMLGSVEDLMVKGYDGNLCFERDFLGEAMDMISRFTAPSEIKDYSANK